ncbi:MAG TPA: DNA alkylation repair protein [Kofleriaceae bacterium]|nr:DNA alkylation repair protein [Kofleriaceae bacterium]
MGKPRAPLDPVADLKVRLARESTQHGRALWYRRGSARLRGVPIARHPDVVKIRSCVRAWWAEHGLESCPTAVGKRIAVVLIEQPMIEHKLAGIVLLQDLLGTSLRSSDLAAFARLFAAGHLADVTVVDWFITKVLVTLLDRLQGRRDVVRGLVAWRNAESMWQRRAACLAFLELAPHGDAALAGLAEQILTVCATVVWSPERFDQTAVGIVLRELSRAAPDVVEAFFRRHALLMSKECARHAVAKYPAEQRATLLAHHKRATSLRIA